MKLATLSLAGALAVVMAGSAMATPIQIFSDNVTASIANPAPPGSTGLGPLGAVGGIGGPVGFIMPFSGIFTLQVVDCCLVGDVFQAFVDGVSLGFTSPVMLNGPSNSSGSFSLFLSAGSHNYDINDQLMSYITFGDPYQGGTVNPDINPAGLTVTGFAEGQGTGTSEVPEPSTFGLLGAGLFAAAGLLRRKTA